MPVGTIFLRNNCWKPRCCTTKFRPLVEYIDVASLLLLKYNLNRIYVSVIRAVKSDFTFASYITKPEIRDKINDILYHPYGHKKGWCILLHPTICHLTDFVRHQTYCFVFSILFLVEVSRKSRENFEKLFTPEIWIYIFIGKFYFLCVIE